MNPEDAVKFLAGINPVLVHKYAERETTLASLLDTLIRLVDYYLEVNYVVECVPHELIEMAGGQEAFEFPLSDDSSENDDWDM